MSFAEQKQNIEIKIELPFVVEELVAFQVMKMFFSNKVKAPKLLMEKVKAIDKKDRLHFETIDLTLFENLQVEVEDERLFLEEAIKKEYKRYKKLTKYISDDFVRKECTVITFNATGEMKKPDCSLATFKKFLLQKDGAPCFSWIHHTHQFGWVDKDMVGPEFKRYKKSLKEGKVKVLEGNNTTHLLDKKEWYSLVVTPTSGCDMCLASMNLFNLYVSGYVYWFNIKENRDSMYTYLTKK